VDALDALREFSFGDGTPLTITVEKPLSAHGQRLADSLGVRVEVRPVSVIDVQAATESSDCLQPGCPFEAENGRTHCRHHRLLGEPVALPSRRLEDRPALLIEGDSMSIVVCKIDGCGRDASDAPAKGFTARLCATHRAEKSAARYAARTGTKGTRSTPAEAAPPKDAPTPVATNGSLVSKAERLLAAARAVDEIEAQLAQARAELKDAAAALA